MNKLISYLFFVFLAVLASVFLATLVVKAEDDRDPVLSISDTINTPEGFITMIDMTPVCAMGIGTPEVGRVEWCGGQVKFSGEVDDSARIFFEYLFTTMILPDWECYKRWKEGGGQC